MVWRLCIASVWVCDVIMVYGMWYWYSNGIYDIMVYGMWYWYSNGIYDFMVCDIDIEIWYMVLYLASVWVCDGIMIYGIMIYIERWCYGMKCNIEVEW